jgi:signal transduction histidine kinase
MRSAAVFALVASVIFLALAILSAIRGRKEPLAARFAVLMVDLFAYNATQLLSELSPHSIWDAINSAVANMATVFAVHFTLAFLGQTVRRRLMLQAVYAYGMVLAGLSLFSITGRLGPNFPDSPEWAIATLVGLLPSLGLCVVWLVQYSRRAMPEERARAQLALGAISLGAAGAATDLAAIAAGGGPHLAGWGLLGCGMFSAVVALRVRMLDGVTPIVIMSALALAFVGVLAQVAVFEALGRTSALLFLGTLVVTFSVVLAARHIVGTYTAYRERLVYHANMGRMSAQMAHDLRNPLAAIRGAAQLLQTEISGGGTLDAQAGFVDLILEQTDRLTGVLDTYQRLGRVEPQRTDVDVRELIQRTVDGTRAANPDATIDAKLGAVRANVDRELVVTAVENLVRNALEATEGKGHVTVETRGGEEGEFVISVSDDGPGMDVRTRERAFEDFYTTKATGSGLGLSFARRVAEAHGGRARIESELGRGTLVALELPTKPTVSSTPNLELQG